MLKLQKFRAEINYCIKLLSTPLKTFNYQKKYGEDITKQNLEGNSNLPTENTKINYKLLKMSLRLYNQQRKCRGMMQT